MCTGCAGKKTDINSYMNNTFFRVHLYQLVLIIEHIAMNNTAMGNKHVLNSQIKMEVKSFCQMTFIMFILYTIINVGLLNLAPIEL